jgi:putative endopeptidase
MDKPIFSAGSILCLFLASGIVAQTPEQSESQSGVDLSAIDKSADPCNDFYRYACGTWLKNNPIPPDEGHWGRFNELIERNEQILRGILEDSEQHQERSSLDQKIGGFYQSCMNEAIIDQRGTPPLQPELDRISQIANQSALLSEVARLHELQVNVFFKFNSSPDPKDAKMMIADIDQGGLGLPEKDFYFRTDPKSQQIRQKYVAHIAKTFELLGVPAAEAAKKAATIMAIETDLAKASLDVTSRRDPKLLVHEMPKAELVQLAPNFNFNAFFADLHSPEFAKLNVSVPDFFKAFNKLLTTESLDNLKDYLRWHYVNASAKLLYWGYRYQGYIDHRETVGRSRTCHHGRAVGNGYSADRARGQCRADRT